MSTQNPCAVAHGFFGSNFNMLWTLRIVELPLEQEGKACSRCHEVKSLTEFYKQGLRHESLCKSCKKDSRGSRTVSTKQDFQKNSSKSVSTQMPAISRSKTELYERELMPVYDESIFYPENSRRALGIDDDEMDSLIAYFRWQLEQREKQKKVGGKS